MLIHPREPRRQWFVFWFAFIKSLPTFFLPKMWNWSLIFPEDFLDTTKPLPGSSVPSLCSKLSCCVFPAILDLIKYLWLKMCHNDLYLSSWGRICGSSSLMWGECNVGRLKLWDNNGERLISNNIRTFWNSKLLVNALWQMILAAVASGRTAVQDSDTLLFKSLGYFYFFKEVSLCSPRLHLFDQKYNKNSEMCEPGPQKQS